MKNTQHLNSVIWSKQNQTNKLKITRLGIVNILFKYVSKKVLVLGFPRKF